MTEKWKVQKDDTSGWCRGKIGIAHVVTDLLSPLLKCVPLHSSDPAGLFKVTAVSLAPTRGRAQ